MKPAYLTLSALALLASTNLAHATGGFDCFVENGDIEFYANGVLGRGIVTPIMGFKANLIIKSPRVSAAPLTLDLGQSLLFSWVEGEELRLHLYKELPEGQHPATLEFVMKTAAADEDNIEYKGTYVLRTQALPPAGGTTAGEPLDLMGEISCGWE